MRLSCIRTEVGGGGGVEFVNLKLFGLQLGKGQRQPDRQVRQLALVLCVGRQLRIDSLQEFRKRREVEPNVKNFRKLSHLDSSAQQTCTADVGLGTKHPAAAGRFL